MGDFSSIGSEIRSGNENILGALVPLLKLLSLTVIGLVLAHPRTRIIPKSTFQLLSKLVFALFLPCMIFTQLGESITLENITRWWLIPLNVLISMTIGCILGYLVAILCRPPPQFFRFTIVMTGFGNTGNLPISIIESVCHGSEHPFGPDCYKTGIAYVSFAQWVAVILVYTLVYHMMEPPLEYYEIVAEECIKMDEEVDNSSRPLLVEAEWPGMEDKKLEYSKTPLIARIFRSFASSPPNRILDLDHDLTEGETDTPKSISCMAEPRVVRKIRIVAEETPIRHILQPPTIASLLAIVTGIVPQFHDFIFADEAPLTFFTSSLEILAGAMVPSVMLILGGMLAEGPNQSTLGIRTTIGIVVARLLVLPLVGTGVVALANKLDILVRDDGDQMYRFVLLMQYATPSAILLAAIASLRGYAVSEASAILFWQHVFAVFSLSLYIFVYFKLLSYF